MSAAALLCLLLASAPAPAAPSAPRASEGRAPVAAVNAVLDDWHRAAAQADEARYFSHFTPEAVFLGTDASERWTRDEFRVWAQPFFARGKAWSFTPVSRHVSLSQDGAVAWFDEMLDTPNLGPSRGSGVLVKRDGAWRIAQYNLSVPIPNELMKEFKARMDVFAREKGAGKGK